MLDHIKIVKVGRWTRLIIIEYIDHDAWDNETVTYKVYACNKLFMQPNIFIGYFGYNNDRMIAEAKAKAYHSYSKLF